MWAISATSTATSKMITSTASVGETIHSRCKKSKTDLISHTKNFKIDGRIADRRSSRKFRPAHDLVGRTPNDVGIGQGSCADQARQHFQGLTI